MANNYNSNYNSNSDENECEILFPTSSIVLLVHGFQSDAFSMQKLADTMMGLGTIAEYYNFKNVNTPITQFDSVTNAVYVEIGRAFASNQKANVLVKVSFTNDKMGTVDEQTEELFHIIHRLKEFYPSKKIITVGHSKGGVVSMNCAIEHPGLIDKLISVGTPYTTTIFNHFYNLLIRVVESSLNYNIEQIMNVTELDEVYVTFDSIIVNSTLKKAFDSFLNMFVLKPNLKKRWNELSNKPKFTPIATRALVINDEFQSDIVVPIESALANDFDGKRYSDDFLLVKSSVNKINLHTINYITNFNLIDFLRKINGIVTANILGNYDSIIDFVFPILINQSSNLSTQVKRNSAKYVHANMPVIRDILGSDDEQLNNSDVALKVLAGMQD